MALWLGCSPEMADPASPDPVERESTKASCVYMVEGQTSYDPRFVSELIGGDAHRGHPMADLFGVPRDTWPALDEEKGRLAEAASPVNLLSEEAPPVFCVYSLPRDHAPDIHHSKFGDDLKVRMDALGVECSVVVDPELQGDNEDAKNRMRTTLCEFLLRHINR
jgi:acetyl esterase